MAHAIHRLAAPLRSAAHRPASQRAATQRTAAPHVAPQRRAPLRSASHHNATPRNASQFFTLYILHFLALPGPFLIQRGAQVFDLSHEALSVLNCA